MDKSKLLRERRELSAENEEEDGVMVREDLTSDFSSHLRVPVRSPVLCAVCWYYAQDQRSRLLRLPMST